MTDAKAEVAQSDLVETIVRESLCETLQRGVWGEPNGGRVSGLAGLPAGKTSANLASSLCTPLKSPNMYSYRAQASHRGRAFSAGIFAAERSNKARASMYQRDTPETRPHSRFDSLVSSLIDSKNVKYLTT